MSVHIYGGARYCLLLLFLSFAAVTRAGAQPDSSSITLVKDNISIAEVFNAIYEQTGFRIFYGNKLLNDAAKVNVNFREARISEVLSHVLQGKELTWVVQQHVVLLKRKDESIVRQAALPQQDTPRLAVSGSVTALQTGPLPGVTVMVKGTQNGGTTDNKGQYTLRNVKPNAVLVFSFIGYSTLEEPVNGRNNIDVALQAAAQALDDIVVVGYGTKKRVNLTGAVSTVGSEVISSRPIMNALSAIQGQIPGMVVQRSSGQPGSEDFKLHVRGISSTNGDNSPLVLIDGIAGSLNLLNPDDIESLTVLKDAAASIYGARAANGVLLVTTKKGKKGAPRISYSGNFAMSKLEGMMETPNTYQYAIMDNEANIHNGAAPMYTPDLLEKIRNGDPNPIPHPLYGGWMLFFTSTDWKKEVFENGLQHKHNINISGGGNNSTYFLSGTYSEQEGVIRYAPDNNKRYNLRLNYDYDISKRVRLESKISLESQLQTDIGGNVGGSGSQWIITEAIFGLPNHPAYTKSGEKFFAQGGWSNAVALAKEAEKATFDTRNINTNFKLIVDVLDGLKLNLQSGINYSNTDVKNIAKSVPLYTWDEKSIAYYAIANPEEAGVYRSSSKNIYRNFTGYLQYNKVFAGMHEVELMGGASHEENDNDWFSAERDHFVTDQVWSINLGGTSNMTNNGGGGQWAISSIFSRLSYAYNKKYILEANLRYDGSSKFHPDKRWGLFPGVAVGWRLSEEAFIRNTGWFDDLKLRASYGETGNQDVVGLYDYLQLISVGRPWPYGPYPFGAGEQGQSAYLPNMVSRNRTWETLINRNLGIDATLLSSRLSLSFDYFIKTNKDMLIPVTYPSVLGATPPYSNSGKLRIWGFEASVDWRDHIGPFQYAARVILSDAQNKIVDYGGGDTYNLGLNEIRQGYPQNTYFAYMFDGVIRTQEELDTYKKLGGVPNDIGIGDAKFRDLNGDGKISPYSDKAGEDGDVVNAGTTTPRYNFGVNLSAGYKNFDLGIFVQGIGKRSLFRVDDYAIPWSDWWRQPPLFYYGKTWNEDRPDAPYPRLTHGNIRKWNYEKSTLQKVNGAYARLKNLQIGYTFPEQLMKRLSISRARIYLSGENLWEVHGVKGGWDPESTESGFNYPFQRLYSAGVDVTF